MPRLRIAVGQISLESNHFVAAPCELDHFRTTGYVYERDDLFDLAGKDGEVAGILATLERDGNVDVLPLLAARGNSSGPLSDPCYSYLKHRLLMALTDAGPVDGVILSQHGSMAAVSEDDPEGDVVSAVRDIVGPRVPIVVTLDLHGNVTKRLVTAANAILGYEHYPHDDTYTTGVRGTDLLLRTVRGDVRPAMAHAKLPLLLTAFNASTSGSGPFAVLMQQAKELEKDSGLLSTSLFLVGSYIDVPDMGCSSIVIADGDADRAAREAQSLARQFWEKRRAFEVETVSIAEALERGRAQAGGPVLLLDTADTTGGGASGDGVGLIKGLLAAGVTEPCLAMVVDPKAAQICVRAGFGANVRVALGHTQDPKWGTPLEVTGRVVQVSDGRFKYRGGILGGTWASMGPSAVLAVGSIQILVMTYPTYDWADEQYRAAGLNPEEVKFVGVKNMMNFRHGYRDVMKGFFVLDLPGPTPADLRLLPFQRVARPIYPLDENLAGPQIRLTLRRR